MEPELLALLQRLNDENAEPLTDEELVQLRDGLRAVGAGIDPRAATQEDIAALGEAADHLEKVDEAIGEREAAAAAREEQARELIARLSAGEGGDAGPEGGEGEGAEGGDAGEGGDAPAGTEGEGGDAAAETEGAQGEPVAAGGAPAKPKLPPIHHLARRRPNRAAPKPTATADTDPLHPVLTAAADMPGIAAGMEIDPERWAQGCVARMEAVRKVKQPGADGEKIYFGTIAASAIYEAEGRALTGDERRDRQIVESVVSRESLAASGGVCGPVAVDYSITTLAQAARPVKQALAQFGAARGGVRYILPHTLAMVTADAPAALWTETNDVNPSAPATKPHATFLCQAPLESYVDAVTSIIQFGNFQARYFPEQIQQYLDTADAVHARLAEATLLAAVSTGSTAVTADNYEVGAARDLLRTLDRACAGYRWRHRMLPDAPLRLMLPAYVLDMFRADLALNMPGDSGGQSERLAVANAEIEGWIKARSVNITWTLDSPTGANPLQGFGAQGAGQLTPWPTTTLGWLFHEGAWMFLDGGELNLGMVRDSVLNKTNDFQMFSETFEKAIFRGHESIQLALKIDPSGASVGTVSPFAGGSETLGS